MTKGTTPHFWAGSSQSAVAFVFSAPGRLEAEEGKPVSGATGKNLDAALKILNAKSPTLFHSAQRYDFRITNAHSGVLHKNIGEGRTEGTRDQIMKADNIKRVLKELAGVQAVILCGLKPGYLKEAIGNAGYHTATVCHCGNRGLSQTFRNSHPSLRGIMDSSERTLKRSELWALDVLRQLAERGASAKRKG